MTDTADPAVEAPQFTAGPWAELLATADTNEFVARAVQHLREDMVVWLTTAGPGGVPAPNPVWFLWDGADTVRVFSTPGAIRIRNLRQNPRVSLNFPGNAFGFDIVVLSGTAKIDPEATAPNALPEFLTKYKDWIPQAGQTPDSYTEVYSERIVITLSRLRGI